MAFGREKCQFPSHQVWSEDNVIDTRTSYEWDMGSCVNEKKEMEIRSHNRNVVSLVNLLLSVLVVLSAVGLNKVFAYLLADGEGFVIY